MVDIGKYIDLKVYNSITPEEQQELLIMFDPKRWAEDRLGWVARDYQTEFFDSLLDNKQIVLRWGRRLGKCLPSWTKVFDPTTGERITIKELYDRKYANVVTMTNEYKLKETNTNQVWDNGIKEVFNVKLNSGRKLDATGNHPLYTINGWKEINELKAGDMVAIPRELNYFGNESINEAEIKLLTFKNGDWETSYNSCIPDIIFKLNKKDIALFLSLLYSYDGHINSSIIENTIEIKYSSISEQLVLDIQHLLLRFGIRGIINKENIKDNVEKRIVYQLIINYKEGIINFINEIGIFEEEFNKVINICELMKDDPDTFLTNDIYWDKIESIISIGMHQTYDLTIPETHNFVVEDIITHNTDSMCVSSLYYADTQYNADPNKGSYNILVVCPYDDQIDNFFDRLKVIINNSPKLAGSVDFKHHKCTFANGSVIKGKTVGSKSNKGAASIRGSGADLIIMDEVDYMNDKEIMNVMQLKKEAPGRIRVIAASTPTGDRKLYYRWCTEAADLGWKHIHVTSLVSKEIYEVNPDNKMGLTYLQEIKNQLTELEFLHEVMAEFGEKQVSLFQKRFLDKAMEYGKMIGWKYDDFALEPPIKMGPRSLGVDWDKAGASTNMVIIEFNKYTNKFYILQRVEIPRHEFTYTEAIDKIFYLNDRYDLDHIYVDRGHGEKQVEDLRKEGIKKPWTGLLEKVKGISFSSKIEVRDPYTRVKIKKEIKPFMVNNAVNVFEKHSIVMNPNDYKTIKQLQDYQIKKSSSNGRPLYSDGEEHIVDCICLALLAFEQNYGDLFNIAMDCRVIGIPDPIQDLDQHHKDAETKPRIVSLLGNKEVDGRHMNRGLFKNRNTNVVRTRRSF